MKFSFKMRGKFLQLTVATSRKFSYARMWPKFTVQLERVESMSNDGKIAYEKFWRWIALMYMPGSFSLFIGLVEQHLTNAMVPVNYKGANCTTLYVWRSYYIHNIIECNAKILYKDDLDFHYAMIKRRSSTYPPLCAATSESESRLHCICTGRYGVLNSYFHTASKCCKSFFTLTVKLQGHYRFSFS